MLQTQMNLELQCTLRHQWRSVNISVTCTVVIQVGSSVRQRFSYIHGCVCMHEIIKDVILINDEC